MTILKNIIPSSVWLTIKAYIDNTAYANKAYINYYDYTSDSETTISLQSTFYKLNSDTTEGYKNDGLVHTNNRITNTGDNRLFRASAIISLTGSNNNDVSLAFFIDGALVAPSEQAFVLSAGGRVDSVSIQCLQYLDTNSYIEVWVKNNTDANNVTLMNMNVIIQQV